MKINPNEVTVRFFTYEDIDDIVNYFYHSPPGFIESIGLNLSKFGDEITFRERYQAGTKELAEKNKKSSIITVFYENQKIGFHTSTHHIPNESLIMHAHFFNSSMRRQGIGTISSVKAAEKFFKEFKLKEIVLKVPLQNIAPLRLLEKLGLVSLGRETLNWENLTHPMECQVYKVDWSRLLQIKKALGIS